MILPPGFVGFFVFLFGIAFGSFLNVVIYRVPRDKSVVLPASACPNCGVPIRPYDNIPLASWLILGGRCRSCKTPISPRYFIIELLTGAVFVLFYHYFGLTLETLKLCIFAFLLIGLIFIDADVQLLPDALTLPGVVIGLTFSFLIWVEGYSVIFRAYLFRLHLPPLWLYRVPSALNSLTGALGAALFIYLVGAVYLRLRGHEGMGFGDVKLMGMVGAFLGLKLALFTIFAGSIVGSFYGLFLVTAVWLKRRRRYASDPQPAGRARAWKSAQLVMSRFPVPFGVFLGSMAIFAALFGDRALDWYWGLFL